MMRKKINLKFKKKKHLFSQIGYPTSIKNWVIVIEEAGS